ncbi:MAG: Rieske 2Fe-2S domain-containing protein [Cypionkella sp.]
MPWIDACTVDDIEPEDLIRFDHAGQTYAVYHAPDGTFQATDGLCTREKVHRCNGLVHGDTIECPKHNGRFNCRTGAALRAPVCVDLQRQAVRVIGGRVELDIG